jgi:CRP/FNR family cyclic AMP-dependent transcriptional regulator
MTPDSKNLLKRESVQRLRVFTALPVVLLDALTDAAEWRTFSTMERICERGEAATGVFGLVGGSAKITLNDVNGNETILGFVGAGDVFGDIECIDGGTQPAVIVALERCTTLFIPRSSFLPFVDSWPELQRRLLLSWARVIRLFLLRSQEQAQLDVPARLAKRLLDLHEIMGSIKTGEGLRLPYSLSQQDLGDLIEATRESVNKSLREWTRAGIVSHVRGILTIRDEKQLRAVATLTAPRRD